MRVWGRRSKMAFTLSCCIFLVGSMAVRVQSAVTDAPHNDTFGISCSSCHTYSFWWQYSPAQEQSNFTAVVDALCLNCHADAGPGPKVLTHSSAVIGSNSHGNWIRACTACHNPHYQDQLNWANSETSPYLTTGTISGISAIYDGVNKETTITYSATDNPNWPAVGDSEDALSWVNKSRATPGRGLILVQDTVKRSNTFSIVAASATEVTVKGEINANMINTSYRDPLTNELNSATCNSFGLIYGGLIRDSINARSVKFFDPNGGFVRDEGSTTTGICQVCHTLTTHYANTGEMPAGADTHLDRNGRNCTICHQHLKGFKGEGHDDTSFAWAGNCATCHNPNSTDVSIINVIHGAKCGLCHVSSAGGGLRKNGDPANGIDGAADFVGATNSSTCIDCHATELNLTSATIHHDSEHHYAADGRCIQCHDSGFGKKTANHSVAVADDNDCSLCHLLTAGTITGMPISATDSMVHDACTTCHNTDGTLKTAYGKAIAMPTLGGSCIACHGSRAQTGGTIHHDSAHGYAAAGECDQCHGDAPEKLVAPHNSFVSDAPECSWCHTATAGLANGMPVSPTDNKVHDACITCHNSDGTLKAAYGKASAMPALGGSCTACHADYFLNHVNVDSYHNTFLRKNGTSCESCHNQSGDTATNVVSTIHKISEDKLGAGGVREGQVVCELCHHRSTGALVNGLVGGATKGGVVYMTGDARKHTLGSTSSCNVCHSYTFPGGGGMTFTSTHASYGDHYNNLRDEESCHRCHNALLAPFDASDEFGNPEVHKLSCKPCHSGTGWALGGSALNHTVFSPSTCSTCHPSTNASQTYHGFSKASGGLTGGYINGSFTFKSVFAGTAADIDSCMSTADNGATWTTGNFLDLPESNPPAFTCAYTYSALPNGPVTMKMKATTKLGVVMNSDVVWAIVESGPVDGASLTVTPGVGQNTLTWDAATDTHLGLRGTDTYEVRWMSGEIPANHPFACTVKTVEDPAGGYTQTTAGTSVFTGTATSFVHNTGLPVNLKANYRVCAYNTKDLVSAGLVGAATITSGPTQFYLKGTFSSTVDPPLTSLTFANVNNTFLDASAIYYQPANPIGTGAKTLVTVYSGVINSTMEQTITAMTSKFSLKSTTATDQWTFDVYAYDPATTNKVLVATSGEVTASVVQKDWYPTMTIQNGGTVPMGNKLLLEVIYNAPSGDPRPTIYYNHQGQVSESRISVTYAP